MAQTHNLTDDERDHIEALIKSFDNHGCEYAYLTRTNHDPLS